MSGRLEKNSMLGLKGMCFGCCDSTGFHPSFETRMAKRASVFQSRHVPPLSRCHPHAFQKKSTPL